MKKLVLYSDQVVGKSEALDLEMLKLINKENPRIAYIPSASDITRKYFNQKIDYYGRLGIKDLFYFDIDMEYDEKKLEELFECDAIHLSGGDTAYFLSNIKKRGFEKVIKAFLEAGKVLIGISAGSIIMSQDIEIVNVSEDYEDTYEAEDIKALGLVDFEFMPHWDERDYDIEEFKLYSIIKRNKIYYCNDEAGIIINDDKIKFINKVYQIENGEIVN